MGYFFRTTLPIEDHKGICRKKGWNESAFSFETLFSLCFPASTCFVFLYEGSRAGALLASWCTMNVCLATEFYFDFEKTTFFGDSFGSVSLLGNLMVNQDARLEDSQDKGIGRQRIIDLHWWERNISTNMLSQLCRSQIVYARDKPHMLMQVESHSIYFVHIQLIKKSHVSKEPVLTLLTFGFLFDHFFEEDPLRPELRNAGFAVSKAVKAVEGTLFTGVSYLH